MRIARRQSRSVAWCRESEGHVGILRIGEDEVTTARVGQEPIQFVIEGFANRSAGNGFHPFESSPPLGPLEKKRKTFFKRVKHASAMVSEGTRAEPNHGSPPAPRNAPGEVSMLIETVQETP
jgi:hypothetical protein